MNRFSEHMLKFIFNIKFNIDDPISGLKIYKLNVLRKIMHFLVFERILKDFEEHFRLYIFYVESTFSNFHVQNKYKHYSETLSNISFTVSL